MKNGGYWRRLTPCIFLLVALGIMMLRQYWGIGGFALYMIANAVAVLSALYLASQATSGYRPKK